MGTNLIITRANGDHVPMQNRRTATRVTSGKQNWALNAEDTLNITVESPFPQKYDIGDSVTVFGRDYKLNRLPKVKRTGMHEFSYDLEFEGVQYDLLRVTYDLTIDTTNNQLQDVQGDSLTGDLRRFMDVLIANANRVFPGKWELGACPETIGDKTLNFGESDNCLAVLQNLCNDNNFGVEFEIETTDGIHTINMKERVGQTLPYTFMYGKGGGLYALNRDNVSSSNIITRLKVYGSTKNITMKYRADRLCLPGKTKAQSYIEKPEAVAKYGIFEARKNFDNIKPTYTGVVHAVVAGNVLQFVDTSFPFDINEKEPDGETTKYLISGMDAKIHFNTGNLAGYDFTIKSYDHANHLFTLNKLTDDRGDAFPSETSLAFQFKVGDEYKITDIAYSADIEQAAETKLEEEATKYYEQNSQPKVQYGLTVTKAWLERLVGVDDDVIVNVFAPGDYLHVVDDDIDVDKSVRIKSLTRNILDPYDYQLTISDITTNTQIINRVISDLIDIDKVLTINNLKNPARARANWRTSQELLDMVFDTEGDYYTDKIKPLSIDTQLLSVGAKSMQFGLINTVFQPNFNGNPNVIVWQGGVLTHYALVEDGVRSWTMADGSATFTQDVPYYLYAQCPKSDGQTAGTFVFTTKQIKVDEDANYWHFLIGAISSVAAGNGVRSLSLTYGFTMVNGRFIKTGRIQSADGTTYFDLDNSEIGGRIVFTSNGEKKTLEQFGYDNTKTVIDGGLVTSGTIQVAGDNKSILAGITGNGTASDSIRFWAGASFENRKTAPFRVMQDGSVVMTKAQVEGVINALSGKIGGFNISQGSIGYGGTSEQDTTKGMKLLKDFIRFVGDNQETRIGVMNQLGYSYNAYFNLVSNMGTTMEIHKKNPTTSDDRLEYIYQPKALYVDGNQKTIGKNVHYDKGYIGDAYTNVIKSWFEVTQKFHFTANNTSYLGIDLPTKTMVDKATGNANIIFDIEIVCDKSMPNRIKVRSQTGAQMYNNDGDTISGLDMEKGDSITLRYYNAAYMVVNKQYET